MSKDSKRASVYRKSAMVVENVVTREDPARKHKKGKQRNTVPRQGENRECCPKAGKRNGVTKVGRVALNLNVLPTENT